MPSPFPAHEQCLVVVAVVVVLDGLAFNWVTNKLYFTDASFEPIVGVFDFISPSFTIVFNTGVGTIPRAIVLDPNAG